MSDLRWDDVRHLLDPGLVGALPDGWVDDTTVADWQTVLDLVLEGSRRWLSDEEPVPTATQLAARLDDARTGIVTLRVEIAPGAWVHLSFLGVGTIDFDVDVREIRGQRALDGLADFLCEVGRALGRSVWLAPEGVEEPMLGYDVTLDRVVRRPASWERGTGRRRRSRQA
ncbi:MAG: hypothetical protein J7503_15125 [Cellulomonas iranensis]|uniref:hypothetical protein n=1 Tax=Cellulomonas iranensis TaxID=76862 RepID=UPI001B27DD31|nr:hypothetical protein [Cellulomonas iranensis]MBO9570138.1 hypothetical protein [Cellulomonas iranensis]